MASEMLTIITEGQATYAEDWSAVAKLNVKIAKLMAAVGPLKKDGTNQHFKYSFTSYEHTAAAVRVALDNAGLAFSVGTGQIIDNGQTKIVPIEVTLADTATGAMRVIRWYGEGQDGQDKGTAKALTAGTKYWMLRNLLISDQEDVDPDAADNAPAKTQPPAKARAEPGPAQKKHWIKDNDGRRRFWAWTNALGLSNAEVHKALGVEHVEEFVGSKSDAADAINAYIEAQSGAPQQEG